MITGPLITAASRFGSSTVTDGDSAGGTQLAAAQRRRGDVEHRRRVLAAACGVAAPVHHLGPQLPLARGVCPPSPGSATAELRVSCGKAGVAHTSSNRNRGVARTRHRHRRPGRRRPVVGRVQRYRGRGDPGRVGNLVAHRRTGFRVRVRRNRTTTRTPPAGRPRSASPPGLGACQCTP